MKPETLELAIDYLKLKVLIEMKRKEESTQLWSQKYMLIWKSEET